MRGGEAAEGGRMGENQTLEEPGAQTQPPVRVSDPAAKPGCASLTCSSAQMKPL